MREKEEDEGFGESLFEEPLNGCFSIWKCHFLRFQQIQVWCSKQV